jgi:uncharacterized protein YdeI (YjbR/CyaY-like superfamily)
VKTLYVTKRRAWRDWLKANGEKEREIWLVFCKKLTGKARLAYDDAVEEALCFGWIDSIIKRLDEERYARKFTPRKRGSKWSDLNIQRARKMIAVGQMTAAGMALVDRALLKRKQQPAQQKSLENFQMPGFILEGLAADKEAWRYYLTLAPSYRRLYGRWVAGAKKEETRQKRLAELVATMRSGRKLGMK